MGKRLSVKHQLSFLDSIYSLLQNGFSIKEAIDLLVQLRPDDTLVQTTQSRLAAGDSFAEAIQGYFSVNMVNQIKIAERHGHLKMALGEIKRFISHRQQQQGKLLAILTYPIFLLCLLVMIIIGIRLFVTPQLTMMDSGPASQSLSWQWGLLLIAPILLIGFGIYWFSQKDILARTEILTRLPLIGGLFRDYYAYYFASNVSLLLASGLEARSIANLMQQFESRSLFKVVGDELAAALQVGHSIGSIIKQHGFLPNDAALFFDRGDAISVIARKLDVYAKWSFDRMWKRSQRLIAIVQPLVFLIIGAVIVGTYLNMLLPMYDTLSEVYK
ncbi:competence type IV pilus assembly protein ComGB [Nicoliella lavandulae]|uniref:Competence type IV pilus assembly protein ComGB n=1 Tax=Nicoliella lavandulae TaxID=3082954 RepID=A0ABU8SKK7_9LACO